MGDFSSIEVESRGRRGVVWAPRSFVELLRRGTGVDAYDVYWDPDEPIYDLHPEDIGEDGGPLPDYADCGCWVVCERFRTTESTTFAGMQVNYTRERVRPVFPINGMYKRDEKLGNEGLPMTLGSWLIECLNQSDWKRRGIFTVKEEKDEAHRAAWRREWNSTKNFVDDTQADKTIISSVQRQQEKDGRKLTTRDEMKAIEAKLHRKADERRRWQERLLKEMGL